ncbi:Membrane protein involved in the export of O-antigen, teichoic acid lipoteichoic acid [Nitrincola lacisaponensis]|uniref:Membrane protein involved in the export of O-antigen, teichoic acid lipoteichoic acid n=1 Tax=Nitrincola lacisaponensis TaxID=267850 RepID=A0A063Y7N8_9GAMM|nr:flippase [Nitrincola lacisaponensis]KDE41135.1 Membrane protein involved in the export of O-antigen, teichoic acid lipoteichoic acid [Nitrincola lacisaponensis]
MLTTLHSKLLSLKNHPGFQRYASNTSWMMAEQILRIIAGLFVGIWVARYLGPEQFGLFSYVLAFTAIFGGVAKLGLDGIIVRELVNQPELSDTYLGTAFWLKVIGAFIVMALMALIVPFTSNDATTNLFIFIIAAGLIFQSFEVVEFYFQSQVQAKLVSICKVIQLVFSSIIKVYLVLTQAELIWFVLVATFDAFSLAASYLIAYKLKNNNLYFKFFEVKIAKSLIKDSWPLVFSSLVVMIYMRIDQIMIKEMMGEYEVGIYAAAVKISEAFYFIPGIITVSLFPAIINAKNISEKILEGRIQKLYSLLIWIGLSISIPVTIFNKEIINTLYGLAYADSAAIMAIHVWSSVFVFLGVAFGRILIVENKAIITLKRTVLGVILNVSLNFILIPLYGLIGAAIATLIAQLVANYMYDLLDKRVRKHWKLKTFAFFIPIKFMLRGVRS